MESKLELLIEVRFLLKRLKPIPLTHMSKERLLKLRNALVDMNNVLDELPHVELSHGIPFRPIETEKVMIDGVEVIRPLVPKSVYLTPDDTRLILTRQRAVADT